MAGASSSNSFPRMLARVRECSRLFSTVRDHFHRQRIRFLVSEIRMAAAFARAAERWFAKGELDHAAEAREVARAAYEQALEDLPKIKDSDAECLHAQLAELKSLLQRVEEQQRMA